GLHVRRRWPVRGRADGRAGVGGQRRGGQGAGRGPPGATRSTPGPRRRPPAGPLPVVIRHLHSLLPAGCPHARTFRVTRGIRSPVCPGTRVGRAQPAPSALPGDSRARTTTVDPLPAARLGEPRRKPNG